MVFLRLVRSGASGRSASCCTSFPPGRLTSIARRGDWHLTLVRFLSGEAGQEPVSHLQLVVDVSHSDDILGEVLREALRGAILDNAGERYLCIHDPNLDFGRIELRIPR
jgi:hypothetical protein